MDNNFSKKADSIIEKLKEELKSVRTGAVSPALVENITVETYGGQTKLKILELAAITTAPPQSLVISPFDPSTIKDIEKALIQSQSNLGASPVVQNNQIFLKFPPLSTEQREKFAKLVNQIIENTRQKIRNLRDQERKAIKTAFEKKEITEDQKFKKEKEIDTQTQKINEIIEEIKTKKINEVMNI